MSTKKQLSVCRNGPVQHCFLILGEIKSSLVYFSNSHIYFLHTHSTHARHTSNAYSVTIAPKNIL